MMKNKRPLAASANATGYPRSRNTTSAANMIGARFWAISCAMTVNSARSRGGGEGGSSAHARAGRFAPRGIGLGGLAQFLEQALGFGLRGRGMTAGRRVDVLELAAHDRDPLDELAQTLQAEEDE